MKKFLVSILLAGSAVAQESAELANQAPLPAKQLTIPAIFAEGGITGRVPQTVRWSPDGTKVSFVQRDDAGERAELWYVDVASGNKQVLVAAQKMTNLAPPPTSISEREKERRTRYSVADYYWAPDSQHILFDALGQLWLYSLNTGTAVQLTSSSEPVQDPRFSPNGKHISYVRKHNLYVRTLDSSRATQITLDSDENILNGEVDWVYGEELDVRHNYEWSPESTRVLFLQTDETHVPVYPITDLIPVTPTLDLQKYPKPGDPNPDVRLGVIGANGGKVQWLNVPSAPGERRSSPANDYYIPRFGWIHKNLVWAEVLNRMQNQLDLYFVDLPSGRARIVLSEKDSEWVEVNDNLTFVGNGDRFLWTSWRDGHTHIYLYAAHGRDSPASEVKLERQLTRGDFEVFDIVAADDDTAQVYFTTNANDARDRQLYRVKFDGRGFERVSRESGTHVPTFGGKLKQYVDNFSALLTPPRLSLCTIDGNCHPFWESRSVEGYKLIPPKAVEFHAEDGTLLYGWLVVPPNAKGKIPVVLHPYGGPGAQGVRNIWGGGTTLNAATNFLFNQLLACEGIGVLSVDNRGMAGRGRAFTTVIKHHFGEVEIKDQLAALQQAVSANSMLDGSRLGFWGWSYGGTMTLWALTRTTAFAAGVAVAPVTNWRDYDSIYTERFMGVPRSNAEAYTRASPLSSAAGLHGSVLLVHGTADDNVHVQNTIQMTQAFIDAGKRFDLMLYPRKTHGISGAAARTDLFTRMQQHFEKVLLGRQ